MLALWILLGLLAAVALLLALPLRIFLRYTSEDGLDYRVKYAVLTLADSRKAPSPPQEAPAKQPKKQPSREKSSSDRGVVLRLLGLGDLASLEQFRAAAREKGLIEVLREALVAVQSLLRRAGRLVERGVFRRFTLHVTIGGDDPADTAYLYGGVCAAVYPLITLLDSRMKFRRRTVDIHCDFDAETRAEFDCQLSYRPWHFVQFLCGLLWQSVRSRFKKEDIQHE